jgi:hypothetical protein
MKPNSPDDTAPTENGFKNDTGKKITRDELYEELWRAPLSKLAVTWGVPIASIVRAAELMNVPRPASGHWQAVARGWTLERAPLPPTEADTVLSVVIKPPQKRTKREPVAPKVVEPEAKPTISIPDNLDKAHSLVKRTLKALTHDTYLHHGMVHGRSSDNPLSVEVSPGQVKRALRILDVIIKAMVERGGRFVPGPESWRLQLFMGKQPVWFRMTEARKRFTLDLTDEEKRARGISSWEKYDWQGSGVLRFRIEGDKLVDERFWEESKRRKMEDYVPEIIEQLAKVEAEAAIIKAELEKQEKAEAEQRHRDYLEYRRREIETQNRKRLEESAEAWLKVRRLRLFIAACERRLPGDNGVLSKDGAGQAWIDWARGHANRIDPFKLGYLESEIKRFQGGDQDDEDDEADLE